MTNIWVLGYADAQPGEQKPTHPALPSVSRDGSTSVNAAQPMPAYPSKAAKLPKLSNDSKVCNSAGLCDCGR